MTAGGDSRDSGSARRDGERKGRDSERDEIARKAAFWRSNVVDAHLRQLFGEPAEHRSAALMLSRLVGDVPGGDEADAEEATCRLMLAALKVSGGSVAKLGMWVEVARSDPRDLIAAAEYSRELQGGDEEARRLDLAEYLSWAGSVTA